MSCFLDTSALIKKYIIEQGSDLVKDYLTQSQLVYVSGTARVECFSVIGRMVTNGDLDSKQANDLKFEIIRDFLFFQIIPFNELTESIALELIQKHRLKTLDSIQLASALIPKQRPDYFLGADKKLNACALLEGFNIVNPNENQP
jgi:predicted nucleic acid-binding protein